MNIAGYAYTKGEEKKHQENIDRYGEIKHLVSRIHLQKVSMYAKTQFKGELLDEECQALSEKDIALIADYGNLCFGGHCTKSDDGKSFWGAYYTD